MNANKNFPARLVSFLPGVLSFGLCLLGMLLVVSGFLPANAADLPPDKPKPGAVNMLDMYLPGAETGLSSPSPDALSFAADQAGVNKLAYMSLRDGNWEIYLTSWDASHSPGTVRLTNNSVSDIYPRINRQVTRIVYSSKTSSYFQLYAMNLDGSNRTQLTPATASAYVAAWSPDGARLVYQREKNSVYDLYLINADGSSATPLTSDAYYDGEPYWSPDGSKIAFVSNRGGGYHVWVMNADGTNLVQLNTLPYSTNPTWSPDGKYIAFSADSNGDQFLELWVMNADGSNQRRLVMSLEMWDVIAWGWNPGSTGITCSYVKWIIDDGQYYWTVASNQIYNTIVDRLGNITSDTGLTDWYPDYQSFDQEPPVSSAYAPAVIPHIYQVILQLNDTGGSGLVGYYAQGRSNPLEPWVNRLWYGLGEVWPVDWPYYLGGDAGYETYVRFRAVDAAGFVEEWPADYDTHTIVEALAPVSAVIITDTSQRSPALVNWSGYDPGDSGIETFDVAYRDANSTDWVLWQQGITNTVAAFSGEVGHSYYFRARGTDAAGSVEDWPAGDGAGPVQVYAWGIHGQVTDHAGVPVEQAVLESSTPLVANPSGEGGFFEGFSLNQEESYWVRWKKTGYGGIPITVYPYGPDASLPVVLPPLDNLVQNSGFESEAFAPAWSTNDDLSPVLDTGSNTGVYAARLTPWAERTYTTTLLVTDDYPQRPAMARDTNGRVHVVWRDDSNGVWYSGQDFSGRFSAPTMLSTMGANAEFKLQFDSLGGLHVVWEEADTQQIYAAYRTPAGIWTPALQVSTGIAAGSSNRYLQVYADPLGNLYAVWSRLYTINYISYMALSVSRWSPSTSWSPVQDVPGASSLGWWPDWSGCTDSAGNLHLGWFRTVYYASVEYARLSADGVWSTAAVLSSAGSAYLNPNMQIGLRPDGRAFLYWDYQGVSVGLYYSAQRWDATWTTVGRILSSEIAASEFHTEIPHEYWYLLQTSEDSKLYRLTMDGIAILESSPGLHTSLKLHSDQAGSLYLSWYENLTITMSRYLGNDRWELLEGFTTFNGYTPNFALTMTSSGVPHIAFVNWNGLWYVSYPLAAESGSSSLSQQVSVPADLHTPILSYLVKLSGAHADPLANRFWVELEVDGATHILQDTNRPTDGWVHAWYDLSQWSGKLVALRFNASFTAGEEPVWAYIDNVTIGAGRPDVWTGFETSPMVLPGGQVWAALQVGNQGPALASGVSVTMTLPAGLSLVNGSVTPAVDGNTLTWQLGDLPGGQPPESILLLLAADPALALWSEMDIPLSINIVTGELETMNNQVIEKILVGERQFIPAALFDHVEE